MLHGNVAKLQIFKSQFCDRNMLFFVIILSPVLIGVLALCILMSWVYEYWILTNAI